MNALQACTYKFVNTSFYCNITHSQGKVQSTNACLLKYFLFEREDKCEQIEFDNTSGYKWLKKYSYVQIFKYKLVNRS